VITGFHVLNTPGTTRIKRIKLTKLIWEDVIHYIMTTGMNLANVVTYLRIICTYNQIWAKKFVLCKKLFQRKEQKQRGRMLANTVFSWIPCTLPPPQKKTGVHSLFANYEVGKDSFTQRQAVCVCVCVCVCVWQHSCLGVNAPEYFSWSMPYRNFHFSSHAPSEVSKPHSVNVH
jgi:hypothetical protein